MNQQKVVPVCSTFVYPTHSASDPDMSNIGVCYSFSQWILFVKADNQVSELQPAVWVCLNLIFLYYT